MKEMSKAFVYNIFKADAEMNEIAFEMKGFTVYLKNIEIDHYAFEDCGLITADVEIDGVSVGYSAYVIDGEIDVYRYPCWEDCTDLIGLLDSLKLEEDGADTEIYKKMFAGILEPLVLEGALTEASVGRLLQKEGLYLFGRDPAKNWQWQIGKAVDDERCTYKTIGWHPSLLAIANALDDLVAEHKESV